jgi:hypothetical protein
VLDFDICYRAMASRDARFDGDFYVAVTTTGVYCRPVCGSRTPKPENVRFFRVAAAAEAAGFRACRRCRPEVAPSSREWNVRGDLVARALRLIAAMAAGEFAGATLAGNGRAGPASMRRIGLCQVGAALAILPVLDVSRPLVVGAGFFGVGLLSAPMTVWAQSLRMRRIPPELHGRSFATLRTLMQGTPPLGAAIAAPLLAYGGLGMSVLVMTLLAGLPGLYLSLSHAEHDVTPRAAPGTRSSSSRTRA